MYPIIIIIIIVLFRYFSIETKSSIFINQPEEKRELNAIPSLPKILMIGTQKAGTTSLASWLYKIEVCEAEIFGAEPFYFSKEVHFFDNTGGRFEKGYDFYAKRFEHCNHKTLAMDATPNTIVFPERANSIYSLQN